MARTFALISERRIGRARARQLWCPGAYGGPRGLSSAGRVTFPAGAEDEYFHNKAHVLAKDGVELFEGPVEHAGGRPEPTLTLWYDVAGMTFQSRVPIGHNERESGIEFMGSNSYVLA